MLDHYLVFGRVYCNGSTLPGKDPFLSVCLCQQSLGCLFCWLGLPFALWVPRERLFVLKFPFGTESFLSCGPFSKYSISGMPFFAKCTFVFLITVLAQDNPLSPTKIGVIIYCDSVIPVIKIEQVCSDFYQGSGWDFMQLWISCCQSLDSWHTSHCSFLGSQLGIHAWPIDTLLASSQACLYSQVWHMYPSHEVSF